MNKLQVPDNITLRTEFVRGIGAAEAAIIGSLTAIAIVLAVAFCMVSQGEQDTLIATISVVTVLALSAGFFAKMDNGQSIYDYLHRQRKYHREQQKFLFKRKEVLEFVQTEEGAAEGVDCPGVC